MQNATAPRSPRWRQRRAADFGSGRARRRDFCGHPNPRLALLHPKATAVHVCLLSDRVSRFNHSLGFLGREHIELAGPALTPHRQALRNRRALRQHTVEPGIMPARREIDRAVMECVAIDEAGERRKWQVGAIDRVGE